MILLFVVCLPANAIFSQKNEFKLYPNGLIYSEQAMTQLSGMVDSLNLKYRSCDLNNVYYSKQQTVGNYIRLDSGNVKEAVDDIKQQMPIDEFLKKYPNSKVRRDVVIIKWKRDRYEKSVEFDELSIEGGYGYTHHSKDMSLYEKDLTNEWLYKYNKKSKYSKESVSAFYFPNAFESRRIPPLYADMIGYADCIIDTTASKMKKNSNPNYSWQNLPKNWSKFSKTKKTNLLEKMRATRVVGGCSQDSRPRLHAVNISLLAAETGNWEVFLKSHLDIMNDRFDRMSDGSYAWAGRKTYIGELEALDINVPDMILGTVFRIENPAKYHYFSSVGRVGRAMSETKYKEELEGLMLKAVADHELDLMNRMITYFLFENYIYNLEDKDRLKKNKKRLDEAAKELPDFIQSKLVVRHEKN